MRREEHCDSHCLNALWDSLQPSQQIYQTYIVPSLSNGNGNTYSSLLLCQVCLLKATTMAWPSSCRTPFVAFNSQIQHVDLNFSWIWHLGHGKFVKYSFKEMTREERLTYIHSLHSWVAGLWYYWDTGQRTPLARYSCSSGVLLRPKSAFRDGYLPYFIRTVLWALCRIIQFCAEWHLRM